MLFFLRSLLLNSTKLFTLKINIRLIYQLLQAYNKANVLKVRRLQYSKKYNVILTPLLSVKYIASKKASVVQNTSLFIVFYIRKLYGKITCFFMFTFFVTFNAIVKNFNCLSFISPTFNNNFFLF